MYSFNIDLTSTNSSQNIKENLVNDFELLKSIYNNDLEEYACTSDCLYEENNAEIIFKIKLKLEVEVDSGFIDIIEELKFSELISAKNMIILPYWLKFKCNLNNNTLVLISYVFWQKKNTEFFDNFQKNYLDDLPEESILFTIIESFKSYITAPEKKVLINWLQQMKEESLMHNGIFSIESIIYDIDRTDDQEYFDNYKNIEEDFDYLSILKARSHKMLEKSKNKIATIQSQTVNQIDNSTGYDKFISNGGISGEVISDRGSTFQSHIIKITSNAEVSKYLLMLKSNNKIVKATHNVLVFRFHDKINKNKTPSQNDITQGFDDDGEDGAGARLLGVLEKMKIYNIMVVVSRWFGGTLLGNDRYKHINDAAKILLNTNKNIFSFHQ
jgi:hypothetical protein